MHKSHRIFDIQIKFNLKLNINEFIERKEKEGRNEAREGERMRIRIRVDDFYHFPLVLQIYPTL